MHVRSRAATTAAATLACLLIAPAAWAETDPNLDQTLAPDAPIAHGQRVLDEGHVDLGPKYDEDGTWRFLVHDDVAKADANATSVWRHPDETVFHVLDEAVLTVPEDPAYRFLGAEPGSEVYVVPQTQRPGVVWLGWNTQDPEVMSTIDRGVTLSLTGVQGPGVLTVYLQSGSFGEPQLLWDSRVAQAQPIWVDVNTHTHANWVFTAPGVYLLELTAEADLVDGSHVSDTQRLRFAVGTGTSTDEALAATWDGAPGATEGPASPDEPDAPDEQNDGEADGEDVGSRSPVPLIVGAAVLVAAGLVAGFGVATVRGNRARRRALAARASATSGAAGTDDPADGGGR